jgi:hypothetical protein
MERFVAAASSDWMGIEFRRFTNEADALEAAGMDHSPSQ